MTAKKDSVPVKIAILLFCGVVIILLSGFLSYKSISSVVRLIYTESKPQHGLTTIREISSNIERAENYIRLYGLTKRTRYLREYKDIASQIDSDIDSLYIQYPDDEWFSIKIDTIQDLFYAKTKIWKEMVSIWQYDTTKNIISELVKEYKPESIDTTAEVNFIKNLFIKKKEPEPINNEKILEKIVDIEKSEKATGLKLQKKETELTESSNMLNEAFLSLTGQLEAYEKKLDLQHYQRAGRLADKTFILIAVFALTATLLSILVLFVIMKYVRKNREYNNMLIQSRQETENLSKAKELFMANVSHEIRTPMNAISGFIEQIMDMPLDDKARAKLEIVNSASNQLLRLINDILDFSKLQAGKLTLQNDHFDPEKVIKNVCTVFSETARKNNNMLSYQIEGEKQILFGDSLRFQQILYNLLSNALKFTHSGTVDVSLIINTEKDHQAKVDLVVKDTGHGIETSKLDAIFKDFTQEDQGVAVKYGGTGLGLSIVKELTALFEGAVSVQSQKGFGTTVTCNLIFQLGDKNKLPVQSVRKKKMHLASGMRFLIADDEEYNRLLIATILEKWKADFDLVSNGVDAIEMLQNNQYDFILTDIRMPDIDGIMVAKFIRETLQLSKDQLPVIGITADISGNITDEVKLLFNSFLFKPFTEEELLEPLFKGVQGTKKPKSKTSPVDGKNGFKKEGDLTNLLRVAGDDLRFVKEMLDQFESSTQKGLAEMKSAIEKDAFTEVGELAHKLASPSRHLGLNQLLATFKEIEAQSKENNKTSIVVLINEATERVTSASDNLNNQFNKINK